MFEHCNSQDIMYQYAIALGMYKVGNLVSKTNKGKILDVNNHMRFVRFGGRLLHKVQCVSGGDLYSFLYYNNCDRNINGGPLQIFACL